MLVGLSGSLTGLYNGLATSQWGSEQMGFPDLVAHLEAGRDFVIDELGFECVAGTLTVSFLDDKAECAVQDMVRSPPPLVFAG